MTYRGWVYGGGFGFQLGLGITTIVTTAAVHATVLLAFLVASPMNGAMVGATFGLARAVPILAGSRVDSVDRLQRLHRTMQGRATAARVAGIVVLWAAAALVGVGLAAA
jgi:sulfite exporter TauE/SafE